MHPIYKKYINKTKKYSVHDEDNKFKVGELLQFKKINQFLKLKHG